MKFILFGCWNNINCEDKTSYNYRDIVIDYINKYEKDYECLFIAGDNWYSNMTSDNIKYYFVNILRSGFIKLYNLNKPCHIILGNHDEDIDSMSNFSYLKKNCMLNTEKYVIDNITSPDILVPDLDYLYNNFTGIHNNSQLLLHEAIKIPEYNIINDIIFIYINTNILSHLYPNNNIGDLLEYCNKIEIILSSNKYKKSFVIGHVPITSLSVKKNKDKHTILSDNANILKKIYDILNKYNSIYLCADTHNFQICNINNIVQIVSGTGGAEPDIVNKNSYNYIYTDNNNSYNVKGYLHNSFGYTIVDIQDDNSIIISYKHIIDNDNNPINKSYLYKIDINNNITFIEENDMDNDIELNIIEKNELCKNLTLYNVVKKNDIFCYRKIKGGKKNGKNKRDC